MSGFKRFFHHINWWAVCAVVFALCTQVNAAEGKGSWRSTYDLIMMWFNFLILVFLFFKFAKTPLKNFLNSRKEEIAREVDGLENQRDEMVRRVKETFEEMKQSQDRLVQIKNKIIRQGEARKQEIIDDAGFQSRIMIEEAQRRVENQILSAKKNIREELIDEAVDIAIKDIGQFITEEDNQKFLQQFLASTQ